MSPGPHQLRSGRVGDEHEDVGRISKPSIVIVLFVVASLRTSDHPAPVPRLRAVGLHLHPIGKSAGHTHADEARIETQC